jgi:hypothetical protein
MTRNSLVIQSIVSDIKTPEFTIQSFRPGVSASGRFHFLVGGAN